MPIVDHGRWNGSTSIAGGFPRATAQTMRVEGRIFADKRLLDQPASDQAPEQVANVASLPGIQMASLAMPDIHWGYGFPHRRRRGDRSGRRAA